MPTMVGIFSVEGTAAQVAIISEAVSRCTFPLERLLPRMQAAGFSAVRVVFNTNSPLLQGGRFWAYAQTYSYCTITIREGIPVRATQVVFLHEVGHFVDGFLFSNARRAEIHAVYHNGSTPNHGWFDPDPNTNVGATLYHRECQEGFASDFIDLFSNVAVSPYQSIYSHTLPGSLYNTVRSIVLGIPVGELEPYDPADPTDPANPRNWPWPEPTRFEGFIIASIGEPLATVFSDIAQMTGGVFYIDPDRVLRYVDDSVISAPLRLSDVKALDAASYREMEVRSSADVMANDALVWGVGIGSAVPAFARVEDTEAITLHGRFQWSDKYELSSLQSTAERRAETYINGSVNHRRGHKDDQDFVTVTVFTPGFRVAQVVAFESQIYGWSDVIPIRRSRVTFPTPTDPRWELTLSHEIDAPFASQEPRYDTLTEETFYPGDVAYPGGEPYPGDLWLDRYNTTIEYSTRDTAIRKESRVVNDLMAGPTWPDGVVNPGSLVVKYPENFFGPRVVGATNAAITQIPWPYQFECYNDGDPATTIGHGKWTGRAYEEAWHRVDLYGPKPWGLGFRGGLQGRDMLLHIRGAAIGEARFSHLMVGFGYQDERWPVPADIRTWQLFALIADSNPFISVPDGLWTSPPGQMEFNGIVRVPNALLRDGVDDTQFVSQWFTIAPSWGGPYPPSGGPQVCDVGYPSRDPADPYAAYGPRYTGQLDSGEWQGDMWWQLTPPIGGAESIPYSGVENGVTWVEDTEIFKTAHPYVAGTLEVMVDGILLRPGVDFEEVEPLECTFRIEGFTGAATTLQVRYQQQLP